MEDYLDIIYNFFPKYLNPSDLEYADTPEYFRQWALLEDARKDNSQFDDLTKSLFKQLNCQNYMDVSLRGVFDLSYKVVLFLPKNPYHEEYPCCVVNVSIIAQYYSIYFIKYSGTPINTLNKKLTDVQKSLTDNVISRIVRNFYPNYSSFPMEYFDEPVPHIFSSKNCNQSATYFECLMTDDIL